MERGDLMRGDPDQGSTPDPLAVCLAEYRQGEGIPTHPPRPTPPTRERPTPTHPGMGKALSKTCACHCLFSPSRPSQEKCEKRGEEVERRRGERLVGNGWWGGEGRIRSAKSKVCPRCVTKSVLSLLLRLFRWACMCVCMCV